MAGSALSATTRGGASGPSLGEPGDGRGQLIAAARERFGRLDGALISVGGSPSGTIAETGDDAWRSAFESVFLGAVRLARVLAANLDGRSEDGESQDGGGTGALTGTGGSILVVLAGLGAGATARPGHFQRALPGPGRGGEDARRGARPGRDPDQRAAAVRIATDRVRELDALAGDPDEVRARLSRSIPLRRYGGGTGPRRP